MAQVMEPQQLRQRQLQHNVPVLVGRYEVGPLLRRGSFATVYLGRCTRTGESVAIEVLDKEKVRGRDLVAHIRREVAVLRRVRHPHVVQLREVMATKTKIFFVMEHVGGGGLFHKVAKGRLKEEVARRYFQQVISAIAFCHERGVFHRDLKPENLLLDEKGHLKVSEFGLSAVADQTGDGLSHTLCGTPAYTAPEVLARKRYDATKVDIWSMGVILFVLMAGYLPFNDLNLAAMCRKICKGEFRCPPWFSLDLVRLVHRMLDTSPDTRITISEIMEHPWFKKDFTNASFYLAKDETESDAYDLSSPAWSPHDDRFGRNAVSPAPLGLPTPASLNAFEIVSFSSGLDLSGLFGERREEVRFFSRLPASEIISKLEETAKAGSFTVRKKGCRVRLEGRRERVNGPLVIAAEIFEVAPLVRVVVVNKKAGDKAEYEEFCDRELKPGLQIEHHLNPKLAASSVTRPKSSTKNSISKWWWHQSTAVDVQ